MNKHFHRIVFNKARGLLMAVAESAASHSGGGARGAGEPRAGRGNGSCVPVGMSRVTAHVMLAWGAVLSVAVVDAHAQISADRNAPANQQATITRVGSNNVPLVNIQTPSTAGVSRNTASQYKFERAQRQHDRQPGANRRAKHGSAGCDAQQYRLDRWPRHPGHGHGAQ